MITAERNIKKGVIIQARMGSTRLPGKIMKYLMGKPVLQHVIERLKNTKNIDEIIVATTIEAEDDIIEKLCKDLGVTYFRGSEQDVLDRYYKAALQYKLDVIVRVTSDCPLIDPSIIDELVKLLLSQQADYCSNSFEGGYARGLECSAFLFESLEKSWKRSTLQYQREHVVLYMKERPDEFKYVSLKNSQDQSDFRITLDEPEDFVLLERVYKSLYKDEELIDVQEALKLIEEKNLFHINSHIQQKAIK